MPIEAFAFDAYGTLFDPSSVTGAVEAAFPEHGAFIGAVWRQKQLEYTWQRTAMGRFANFATVTREALRYAVGVVHADVDERVLDEVCTGFDRLDLVPEALETLRRLGGRRLAILSNGSDAMLTALLRHAGIAASFEHVIGSDRVRAYKPDPEFYRTAAVTLGLKPSELALVSSNGFDLAGAKHFGLTTIRVGRVPPDAMRGMVRDASAISPATTFAALRSQMDPVGADPDHSCKDLLEVVAIADRAASA